MNEVYMNKLYDFIPAKGIELHSFIEKIMELSQCEYKDAEKIADNFLDVAKVRESNNVIYRGSLIFPTFKLEFDLKKR